MDQGTMTGKAPALETQQFNTVCEILRRNHNDPARLIPILQQVQKEYRYLPAEVLTFIATPLRLRPAQVYGVATFYSHFSLQPHGKYTIRLCDGTACHVRRSTGRPPARKSSSRSTRKPLIRMQSRTLYPWTRRTTTGRDSAGEPG